MVEDNPHFMPANFRNPSERVPPAAAIILDRLSQ